MSTQIKERPIIFNTAMVQAILSGSKSQSRRVIKIKGVDIHDKKWVNAKYYPKGNSWFFNDGIRETWETTCPYGGVGDRLWCKQNYLLLNEDLLPPNTDILYRITLEITEVRVERQLDITLEDAIKEGFSSEREFNEVFLRLNPHLKAENPWVWCISFQLYRAVKPV